MRAGLCQLPLLPTTSPARSGCQARGDHKLIPKSGACPLSLSEGATGTHIKRLDIRWTVDSATQELKTTTGVRTVDGGWQLSVMTPSPWSGPTTRTPQRPFREKTDTRRQDSVTTGCTTDTPYAARGNSSLHKQRQPNHRATTHEIGRHRIHDSTFNHFHSVTHCTSVQQSSTKLQTHNDMEKQMTR